MSYQILEHKDGGYTYSVTASGLTMTGWRRGTRAQVEEYAHHSSTLCENRAKGLGHQIITKNGKISTSHLRGGAKKKGGGK